MNAGITGDPLNNLATSQQHLPSHVLFFLQHWAMCVCAWAIDVQQPQISQDNYRLNEANCDPLITWSWAKAVTLCDFLPSLLRDCRRLWYLLRVCIVRLQAYDLFLNFTTGWHDEFESINRSYSGILIFMRVSAPSPSRWWFVLFYCWSLSDLGFYC